MHKERYKTSTEDTMFNFCSVGTCEGISSTCWETCLNSTYNKRLAKMRKFLIQHGFSQTLAAEIGNVFHFYRKPDPDKLNTPLYFLRIETHGSTKDDRLIEVFVKRFFKGYKRDLDYLFTSLRPDVFIFPLDETTHQWIIEF